MFVSGVEMYPDIEKLQTLSKNNKVIAEVWLHGLCFENHNVVKTSCTSQHAFCIWLSKVSDTDPEVT